MSEIIQFNKVAIFQDERTVVGDLTITINKGEFVYLLGKTGSGKSSFLKTIYGDLSVNVGEAKVFDYDLKNLKQKDIPFLRRKLGIVFQDFQLLGDRSVFENLRFVMKATGWKEEPKIKERIYAVAKQVNLEGKAAKGKYCQSIGKQS